MSDDPICGICNERRSAHIPTEDGPLTCPRLARGEGVYELVRPGYTMSGAMGGFPGGDDIDVPPLYKFVPHTRPREKWDNSWRPADEKDNRG